MFTVLISVVLQSVRRALLYDERRGAVSVGSQLRDAASYVLWAFARAFSPEVLAPHIPQIAAYLCNIVLVLWFVLFMRT